MTPTCPAADPGSVTPADVVPPELVKARYPYLSTSLFLAMHVGVVVGIAVWGWSWSGFGLAVALYYVRMFFVTAGYHRYFAHRTYRTSRVAQFAIGVMAETTAQKGVLWWAAHHRTHHKYSDTERDLHSPRQRGFLWAHIGWLLSNDYIDFDLGRVPDLARYPELRWLNRLWAVPPAAMAAVCFLAGGAHAAFWGFLVSTVLLWHGTFTINSLSHLIGRRRFETSDDSRNHWLLALLTMGEGWHNNHHYYQSSVQQGFRWYEFDMSYLVLRVLAALGLVWDLREPPKRLLGRAEPAGGLAAVVGDRPANSAAAEISRAA